MTTSTVQNPASAPRSRRTQILSFDALGISQRRLDILKAIGFEKPTPVQAGMIPLIMEGHDMIGQARTGTGKTAAFGIPIVERMEALRREAGASDKAPAGDRYPKVLVLVPTRELCLQVHLEIQRLTGETPDPDVGDDDDSDESDGRDTRRSRRGRGRSSGKSPQRSQAARTQVRSLPIYGGKSIRWQINRLAEGADVIVGTPGRIIDHMQRATLNVDHIDTVVLDEADRMLDIGFRPDIERILRRLPEERQMLLLSATLPPAILNLARNYMDRPKLANFSPKSIAAETIDQYYVTVREHDKVDVLIQLMENQKPHSAIIFCRTKLGTERLYRKLVRTEAFADALAIHGDMNQSARDRVMASFRSGETKILVATDVVGRGIDVSQISHIINFDIPELSDDYVHRVGRAGRMGREGVAFTLVTPMQKSELKQVEKRIDRELQPYDLDGHDIIDIKEQKARARRPKRYLRGL